MVAPRIPSPIRWSLRFCGSRDGLSRELHQLNPMISRKVSKGWSPDGKENENLDTMNIIFFIIVREARKTCHHDINIWPTQILRRSHSTSAAPSHDQAKPIEETIICSLIVFGYGTRRGLEAASISRMVRKMKRDTCDKIALKMLIIRDNRSEWHSRYIIPATARLICWFAFAIRRH